MIISPQIDKKILARFDEIIGRARMLLRSTGPNMSGQYFDNEQYVAFETIQTNAVNLMEFILGQSEQGKRLTTSVLRVSSNSVGLRKIIGVLEGLRTDYEAGLLRSLASMIEADVAADYLGQAERLLTEGQPGQYDHVPAAVLTGAILEDGLRRLCQRQDSPIDIRKPDGQYKTNYILIDDLKKAGLCNELKAKQLRAWADIRNAAAHGRFDEFNHQDVEQMLGGVQNFLTEYL